MRKGGWWEKLWRPPRWGLAHEAFSMWVEACVFILPLRLAVVNDVWDNGVTDVTVGVIAQG